jgi:hypothetical protein
MFFETLKAIYQTIHPSHILDFNLPSSKTKMSHKKFIFFKSTETRVCLPEGQDEFLKRGIDRRLRNESTQTYLYFYFIFLDWGETEPTWYVGH